MNKVRYGCYEVEEVEGLKAALESALTGESAALEEIFELRAGDSFVILDELRNRCRQKGYERGLTEERARWEAKVITMRALRDSWAYQAVDQVWHVLDKALAIMEPRHG